MGSCDKFYVRITFRTNLVITMHSVIHIWCIATYWCWWRCSVPLYLLSWRNKSARSNTKHTQSSPPLPCIDAPYPGLHTACIHHSAALYNPRACWFGHHLIPTLPVIGWDIPTTPVIYTIPVHMIATNHRTPHVPMYIYTWNTKRMWYSGVNPICFHAATCHRFSNWWTPPAWWTKYQFPHYISHKSFVLLVVRC